MYVEAGGGMTSILFAATGDVLADSVTEYCAMAGMESNDCSATEGEHNFEWACPGSFDNFRVDLSNALGGGDPDVTFTLRIDGADTSLVCTISGGGSSCTASGSVSISEGQEIALERTTGTVTPTDSAPSHAIEFTGDNANESCLGGHALIQVDSATAANFSGDSLNTQSDANSEDHEIPAPVQVDLVRLRVRLTTVMTSGTRTFTVRECTPTCADTILACTIDGAVAAPGDQECSDTDTVTVEAGNNFLIRMTSSSPVPAATQEVGYSVALTETNDKFLVPACRRFPTAGTQYLMISGGDLSDNATDTPAYRTTTPAWTATEIACHQDPAPGAGENYDYQLREDGVSVATACTISGTATSSTTDITDEAIAAGDNRIGWIHTESAAPTARDGYCLAVAGTIP